MPRFSKQITINSRKIDGKIHKSWKAELLEENEEFYLFLGKFDLEVKHSKLGVIRRGTLSYEYYWKQKWFNVFRFHEPEGSLRNFYCNINQPPVLKNDVLDYIDLELDVLVWKDFNFEILDLDEFEEAKQSFNFSEEIISKSHESLNELLQMIETKRFPFNFL